MQGVWLAGLRITTVLVPLLCLAAAPLPGAVEEYDGKPIGLIAFEPAEQPLTASEIAEILPLKKGEPLRPAGVREAIRRLYATGRFSDIVVDAGIQNGQVAVRFITTSAWFVGQVSVDGAPSPPSSSQLVNSTGLNLGSPFYPDDVAGAVDGLRQLLASNGFFAAKIEPKFTRDNRTGQVNVHFELGSGKRARFAPPEITGDLKRPASRIMATTGWKGWFGWQLVTDSRVQRGLERILQSYRKQDYLMARVTLEGFDYDAKSGRAVPRLSVSAGPKVLIEATGAKVSRNRLKRLVPVFEEQAVDQDLLNEGSRDLTDYFQTRGYFDTKVTFALQPVQDGQLRIQYAIDRGERHKLVQLDIGGNRYFDLKTLRERMFVTPASTQVRRGRYSAAMLAHDLGAISELYRANGFRDVKAVSQVRARGKRGDIAVSIGISEGNQRFVSATAIEGASAENEQTLRSMLQSGPGQPFSDENVAADRDNILSFYHNRGYPSASFEWSFRETGAAGRVELLYGITEGSRRFVREVLISGLRTTNPQLVNRRIGINPGDPVSQAEMLSTQRRLYDLGIFAKVDMATQNPDGDEPAKYLLLQLDESRKYSITAGFGAEIAQIGGSQTSLASPAGEAGFSPRVSFDFSRFNFLGLAHTVSVRTRLSSLQRRALVSYLAPQIRNRQNLDLSFTALVDDSRNVRTFSSKRWEGSTQLTHRWTRSKTFFYRFAYRRVSVSTLKLNQDLIPLLSQPVRVGVLSAAYVDDRRDDPVDSRKGTYNSFDIGTASKVFGSQTDYFRLLGRNSTYHRIGSRLVLARTLSFGVMETLRKVPGLPPSPQDIPLSERFFAGGASTHRGFPENQAGPRDLVTGFPLGGKALLAIGTEIRFPLYGQNLGGVLFHDAGNVYSSLRDISFRVHQRDMADFDYMVHAVGLGFRYRTPIGPFRIDLAYGPNSPRFIGCSGTLDQLQACASNPALRSERRINRFQFHFSLGQSF
jgi:outer membrane protein insertion porin family